MRKVIFLLSIISALAFSGCSMLAPKKTNICIIAGNTNCPKEYFELDGSIVASGSGIVTNLVTTCINVSESNVTCPDNIFSIQLDLIK